MKGIEKMKVIILNGIISIIFFSFFLMSCRQERLPPNPIITIYQEGSIGSAFVKFYADSSYIAYSAELSLSKTYDYGNYEIDSSNILFFKKKKEILAKIDLDGDRPILTVIDSTSYFNKDYISNLAFEAKEMEYLRKLRYE